MALTRDIRFRVTAMQFEAIKNKAQSNGFKTISSFIRRSLLKEKDETHIVLEKIYEILSRTK